MTNSANPGRELQLSNQNRKYFVKLLPYKATSTKKNSADSRIHGRFCAKWNRTILFLAEVFEGKRECYFILN